MRPVPTIAKQSQLSVLGALGQGASGGIENNQSSQLNAAPLGPGVTATFNSGNFISRTGKVMVAAQMLLSKNGGTLAAGDVVIFTISRSDLGTIGPDMRATAVANGIDVIAFGIINWIDALGPPGGVGHSYNIIATIGGGHTGGVAIGECAITIFDV